MIKHSCPMKARKLPEGRRPTSKLAGMLGWREARGVAGAQEVPKPSNCWWWGRGGGMSQTGHLTSGLKEE